jgi:hypothetical protein
MTDKRLVILAGPMQRQRAKAYIDQAPDGYAMKLGPSTRTLEQNAKLHALFSDVAKQAKYHGRTLTDVQWKTLFISAHAVATGLGADMIPGLEGEFVNIRESSAQMTVGRMSSLIEYVTAWAAENNIRLGDMQPVQPLRRVA